jgi:hypothetical protein
MQLLLKIQTRIEVSVSWNRIFKEYHASEFYFPVREDTIIYMALLRWKKIGRRVAGILENSGKNFIRSNFFGGRLRREIRNNSLSRLKDIPTRGTKTVAFDDSVADGFGLADADKVFAALGAGEVGAADVGAFVSHGG